MTDEPKPQYPSHEAVSDLVESIRSLGDRARFLAVNLAVVAAKMKQQGVGQVRLNEDILDLVSRVTRVAQDVTESVSAIEAKSSKAASSSAILHGQWQDIGVPDERTLERLTRSLHETLELSRYVFRWLRDAAPADTTPSTRREGNDHTWADDVFGGGSPGGGAGSE